jgi:hypothetical protein
MKKNTIFLIFSVILSSALGSCGPTHEHQWDNGRQVVEATCTQSGIMVYDCSTCSKTKEEVIEAKGHKEVIVELDKPTCSSTGYTDAVYCSICHENLVYPEFLPIDPNLHNLVVTEAVEPTCTEIGLTEGLKCSLCNEEFIKQEKIEPKGHYFSGDECDYCGYVTAGLLFYQQKGCCDVIGYNGVDKEVYIPATYQGKPVTSIVSNAFFGNKNITSVIIGNNVETINDFAFQECSNLKKVIIGNNVKIIGRNAFFWCGLKEIVFGTSDILIQVGAFSNCPIDEIIIPKNVYMIENYAFAFCITEKIIIQGEPLLGKDVFYESTVKTVEILGELTRISEETFKSCYYMTSLVLPSTVSVIGTKAFFGCYELNTIYYTGTEEQWNNIAIGNDNEILNNVNIIYNYEP